MNRFLAFGGATYYASGGFKDFIGDFNCTQDAHENEELKEYKGDTFTWWHIVDSESGEIIEGSGLSQGGLWQGQVGHGGEE